MRFGINLGHFAGVIDRSLASQVALADDLGFDSAWCAEAYGSDAFTPLAFLAGHTTRMRLGTAVAQIPARAPTAAAMAANTVDHLSNGRFVLGFGASGPQVSEGWYGEPFAKPLARTREYLGIVRQVLDRAEPVSSPGPHYPLPLPGGTGLGKALKSALHPVRPHLPVVLGAEGPRNVSLAAEIADGWLGMFLTPSHDAEYRDRLGLGFEARGGPPQEFEVLATVPLVIDHDLERAADQVRPMVALYIGGMGARDVNFHHAAFTRIGFGEAADAIQAAYLGGDRKAAIAAVPTSLVDEIALIGSEERIRDRIALWEESVVDTVLVDGLPADLKATARALNLG